MKIELKKLRYVYPSGDEALKGINLEIEGTDPVAVIGQNGAGKNLWADRPERSREDHSRKAL